MLKISNVEKSYRTAHGFRHRQVSIVKGVSFNCPLNSSIAIIGESGSGKSTLSRMILGLEKPDNGSVTLEQQPIYKEK